MTISGLIKMCDNITSDMEIMIYHTPYDYDNDTPNWNSASVESLQDSNMEIVKFSIHHGIVAVALA